MGSPPNEARLSGVPIIDCTILICYKIKLLYIYIYVSHSSPNIYNDGVYEIIKAYSGTTTIYTHHDPISPTRLI